MLVGRRIRGVVHRALGNAVPLVLRCELTDRTALDDAVGSLIAYGGQLFHTG